MRVGAIHIGWLPFLWDWKAEWADLDGLHIELRRSQGVEPPADLTGVPNIPGGKLWKRSWLWWKRWGRHAHEE